MIIACNIIFCIEMPLFTLIFIPTTITKYLTAAAMCFTGCFLDLLLPHKGHMLKTENVHGKLTDSI